MARARNTSVMEEDIAEAIKTVRLPKHDESEFETPRTAVEYAPPSVREEFTEAAAATFELPPERIKVIEQGLTAIQQTQADRDRLRREVSNLRQRIVELETTLATKLREEDVIEARVRDCIAQRDGATEEAAELRGVLSSLAAICVSYFNRENHSHEPRFMPEEKDQSNLPQPSNED